VNLLVKVLVAVIALVWSVWTVVDLVVGEPTWVVWLIRVVLTAAMGAGCVASWNRPPAGVPTQATLPENVRFELDDGSMEVVNLAYLGYRQGCHAWGILREVPDDLRGISMDNKPASTVIFAMRS
jgi:hypothetical protein